jgi:hypothetical protein
VLGLSLQFGIKEPLLPCVPGAFSLSVLRKYATEQYSALSGVVLGDNRVAVLSLQKQQQNLGLSCFLYFVKGRCMHQSQTSFVSCIVPESQAAVSMPARQLHGRQRQNRHPIMDPPRAVCHQVGWV